MRLYLGYFLCVIALTSCRLIDHEEPQPGYLRIDKIAFYDSLSSLPAKDEVQKFTDAWVYVDEQLQGVYELPVRMPLLLEGKHSISIAPGIIVNGIAAARKLYPFAKVYTTDAVFTPTVEQSITPQTSYQYQHFKFIEDFENPTFLIDTTKRSNTGINRVDGAKAFRGQYSAHITLNDTNNVWDMETIAKYSISTFNPNPIYLEMNYKTDFPINIGLYLNQGSTVTKVSKLYLNPNKDWNKVYIDLTTEVKTASANGQTFSVYLSAIKDTTQSAGSIYLDELKLIY